MRKHVALPVTLLLAGALALPGLALAEDEDGGSSPASAAKRDPTYPSKAQTMKIAGEMQFRFTHIESDYASRSDDEVNSFGFKRARLAFTGDITQNLFYQMKFQFDSLPLKAAAAKGDGSIAFNTTFLGYRLGPVGSVMVGRFDVPSTPRANSSGQAFAERPYHVEQNYTGGQLGILTDSDWFNGVLGLNLGVFNGNGDTSLGNSDRRYMYTGRVTVSTPKFEFEKESDLKNSNWGVGLLLGGWTNNDGARGLTDSSTTKTNAPVVTGTAPNTTTTTTTVVTPSSISKTTSVGGALTVRGKGFCFLVDYTHKKVKLGQGADGTTKVVKTGAVNTTTVTKNSLGEYLVKGWSAQASYAIPIAKIFLEPKVRYERFWDPSRIDSATGNLAAPAANSAALAKEASGASGNFAWTTVGLNVWLTQSSFINVDYVIKREMGDVPTANNNTLLVQANHYF